MDLIIRQAVETDAVEVARISSILTVPDRESLIYATTGFPKSTDVEEYAGEISSYDYFYVAEVDFNIIGFLSGFDLGREKRGRLQDWSKGVRNFLRSVEEDFAFVEEIGVQPDFQGNGIATRLEEYFFGKASANGINKVMGGIYHKPFKNQRSINLHLKLGYTLLKEVDGDGMAYALYQKIL